jgi:quaternary ammonium compound-resistance protein SugE
MANNWIVLSIAVVTEIAWALSLKVIQQRPDPWLIVGSFLLSCLNMALLSFAMRGIPAGTAYAIWTGLGGVGVTLGGIIFFGEATDFPRIFFLGLVLVGVVGLKLAS